MLMTTLTFRPLSGIAAALDVLKAIATRHHADRRLAYRFVTWHLWTSMSGAYSGIYLLFTTQEYGPQVEKVTEVSEKMCSHCRR